MKEMKNKITEKNIKKLEKEIKLWKDLENYVKKKMAGKTLTKPLEKEINYMLKERMTYLSNLLKTRY